VVLTTHGGFRHLTEQVAAAFGLPDPRIVAVEHPLGGVEEDVIIGRAHSIVEEVLRLWTA
jgi:hypothetical protein